VLTYSLQICRIAKGAVLYIDTPEILQQFTQRASQACCIAIDTEFIREKTYYPRLCLIQLAARFASDEEYAIVDPLAISDLGPLRELLDNPQIVKVFHSCDQDVAILYHELGCLPKPLFDTQRAAQLLGHVQQIGLSAMVKAYCDIRMDKTDTYTDWAQRPLTETQLEYAYNDVRYLPRIYEIMYSELSELGRLSWLDEEFSRLSNEATYQSEICDAWKRVKHASSLKPRQLNALRELAAWRERVAQQRDYPRKWIISDEMLVEIARRLPQTSDELYHVRGAREKLSPSWVSAILHPVHVSRAMPSNEWPELDRVNVARRPRQAQLDLLTALVHQRASENRIAHGILASHDDIVSLASGKRDKLEVLKGWRREMVGAELVELLEGSIGLSLEGGRLRVTPLEPLEYGNLTNG
jgi:ribonuclease D